MVRKTAVTVRKSAVFVRESAVFGWDGVGRGGGGLCCRRHRS
jgi:hypothetical protein